MRGGGEHSTFSQFSCSPMEIDSFRAIQTRCMILPVVSERLEGCPLHVTHALYCGSLLSAGGEFTPENVCVLELGQLLSSRKFDRLKRNAMSFLIFALPTNASERLKQYIRVVYASPHLGGIARQRSVESISQAPYDLIH